MNGEMCINILSEHQLLFRLYSKKCFLILIILLTGYFIEIFLWMKLKMFLWLWAWKIFSIKNEKLLLKNILVCFVPSIQRTILIQNILNLFCKFFLKLNMMITCDKVFLTILFLLIKLGKIILKLSFSMQV